LYNSKLKAKIESIGEVVPESSQWTALFTDGTRIQICKPDGIYFVQREFYHGKDKIRCMAFQDFNSRFTNYENSVRANFFFARLARQFEFELSSFD